MFLKLRVSLYDFLKNTKIVFIVLIKKDRNEVTKMKKIINWVKENHFMLAEAAGSLAVILSTLSIIIALY